LFYFNTFEKSTFFTLNP